MRADGAAVSGAGAGAEVARGPLTVLQVHTRYRQPGGEDVEADAEARLLTRAGHRVTRWVATNPPGLGAAASLAMAPWNPGAARHARRLVEEVRPDVAHVHNTWFALSPAVVRALHESGVPVVMSLHNFRLACLNGFLLRDGRPCTDCVGRYPWRGVVHRCHRGSVATSAVAAATTSLHRALGTWNDCVDRFTAPSEYVRSAVQQMGIAPDRVTVKPNTFEDPGPRQEPPSRSATVLFAGRLSVEKGLSVLLEAWSRRRPGALELAIAGGGPQLEAARAAAGPGVRILGRLDPAEMTDALLRARAVVVPSLSDPAPRSVNEAMAAGLPVLGSTAGGIPELVSRLGPSWCVEAGSVEAWADALGQLEDDAHVDAAGEAARGLYEDRFSPDATLAALLGVYRSVT
jgi:glycosyltransferase involved in cell wall biosynthesis